MVVGDAVRDFQVSCRKHEADRNYCCCTSPSGYICRETCHTPMHGIFWILRSRVVQKIISCSLMDIASITAAANTTPRIYRAFSPAVLPSSSTCMLSLTGYPSTAFLCIPRLARDFATVNVPCHCIDMPQGFECCHSVMALLYAIIDHNVNQFSMPSRCLSLAFVPEFL